MTISREAYERVRRRQLARIFAARQGAIIADRGYIPEFMTPENRQKFIDGLIKGRQALLAQLRYAYYQGMDDEGET